MSHVSFSPVTWHCRVFMSFLLPTHSQFSKPSFWIGLPRCALIRQGVPKCPWVHLRVQRESSAIWLWQHFLHFSTSSLLWHFATTYPLTQSKAFSTCTFHNAAGWSVTSLKAHIFMSASNRPGQRGRGVPRDGFLKLALLGAFSHRPGPCQTSFLGWLRCLPRSCPKKDSDGNSGQTWPSKNNHTHSSLEAGKIR